MLALARGQANSCSLPILVLHSIFDGVLKDAYEASFAIHLVSDGSLVFPVSPATEEAIDTDDCPTGDRLGVGTYVATWTVASDETIGRYTVTWYYKETATSDEVTWSQPFEVVRTVFDERAPTYAFVDDLRCDICDPKATSDDEELHRLIIMASRYIERYTGRFFEPHMKSVYLDGHASTGIRLQDPIIAIGEVAIDFGPLVTGETAIEVEDILVYNRHLSQELFQPDDRNAPKIELFRIPEESALFSTGTQFPRGRQNIRVQGVFGYTDPNGTPIGQTPHLIQHACKLIAIRNMPKLMEYQKRERALRSWRVTGEGGAQSSYQLADLKNNPAAYGRFTGDPEIDQLLSSFTRPPRIGAA